MSNIVFLLMAVGISVVGSVVLWLRTRKPTTVGSSVDSFTREMRALAPDHDITGTTGSSGKAEPRAGFRTLGESEITVSPPDPEPPRDGSHRPGRGRHDGER